MIDAAQQTALALIGQYGDDAEVIATLRAAEFAAAGDVEALAHWDAIIARIVAIEAGAPGARSVQ